MPSLAHLSRLLVVAAPLAVVVAANPAAACPNPGGDPCAGVDYWDGLGPINAAGIASDGALVLQGVHHVGADADWLGAIEISVSHDGQPIAGTLATTSQQGVLLWHPTDEWIPGATYQLSGQLSNPVLPDYQCGEPVVPFAADLTIDTLAGAALGPPAFTGDVQPLNVPALSLDGLVCCPGAIPSTEYGGCGPDLLIWDPAVCAPTSEHRYLTVTLTGQPAAPGPIGAQIGYTLAIDGQFRSQSLIPSFSETTDTGFCAVITAENLATGETAVSPEQCFGKDQVDQLGAQPLDPSAVLDCALQHCATVGMAWDLSMCTPYDPADPPGPDTMSDDSGASQTSGDTTDTEHTDTEHTDSDTDAAAADDGKGCDVAADHRDGAGLLALCSLLVLTRRRR